MAQAPALPGGFELPLEPRLPRIGSVDAVALEERAGSLAKRSIKRDAKVFALELAIRLAGHPGGITVITLAADAARAAALRQRATARLQSESIAFRLRDLGAADTSAAIELLRREHGSLVLLPVDGTMPAGLSLQILLQRLGLPVLQVRAKGSEPA